MWKLKLAGWAAATCFSIGIAAAADFVNLDWGDFKLAYESSARPKSVSPANGNGGLGMTMVVEGFSAGADGSKLEGSASISGEFVVQQPNRTKLPTLYVELKGTLIKTPGTSAEIVATIGPSEQRVNWPPEGTIAGKFVKNLVVEVPNGQLPVPFPVTVQAFVKRDPGAGAILLTLDSIDIHTNKPGIANMVRQPKLAFSNALPVGHIHMMVELPH